MEYGVSLGYEIGFFASHFVTFRVSFRNVLGLVGREAE